MKSYLAETQETAASVGMVLPRSHVIRYIRSDFEEYAPGLRAARIPIPATDEGKLFFLLLHCPDYPK